MVKNCPGVGATRFSGHTSSGACRFARLAACLSLFWPLTASAAPATASPPPLLFLGDKDYPPVAYLDNGVARGMDVDLANALGAPLHRPVRVELMDWNLAQQKVLNGQADGLIGLSISPERQKVFDFAAPTFSREFGLIIRARDVTIHGVADLAGKRVGMTEGGYPRSFFTNQRRINIVLINNYQDGFNRLLNGSIDAMAADLWVAAYDIEKYHIHGVIITGKPFATTQEAIAVRKGNLPLLAEINRATAALKTDGSIARIQDDWRPQEILFASREHVRNMFLAGGSIVLALVVGALGLWIATLKRQMRLRRKTELALKDSEERWRNLTEAAFEGICISENGAILDVNQQFLAMFGYSSRDEVLGKKIVEVVAPESRAVVAESIRAGREEIYEHRLLRKDGTSFIAEARAKMVRTAGRTRRMTALRDITDYRQVTELNNMQIQVLEMITSDRPMAKTLDVLLRMIESQAPEMLCSILLIETDGVRVRHVASPSLPAEYVRSIDGLSIGPCAGSCGTAAHRREPVFVADIETDPLWVDYKHFALPHGLRACWSTPIFDPQRTVVGIFGIYYRKPGLPETRHLKLVDVATHTAAVCIAKHRMDEALHESEEKFSKAFRTSPDVMSITDLETGRYLEVNDAHEKTFGFTREEAVGHSPAELGIYVDSSARAGMIETLKQHGRFTDLEIQTRARDGRVLTVLHSAELIELGGRQCVLRVSHDITGRKQAETERAEAVAREQQARIDYTLQLIASQEAERARIAGELHDSLGQSLSLIKNRAQLALLEQNLSAPAREQLEAISDTTAHAINEVRQISRDLHPYQLDHLGLTRALEALVDSADEASDIRFNKKLDAIDNAFSRDAATNLYRIVQEGTTNILKYSRARNARVILERDVHDVQLTIEDDGCGFETGARAKGMGLKNIAERTRMLGGGLKLDSAPGQGTRIKITIPISAEAE